MILDGKAFSLKKQSELKKTLESYPQKPTLAVILAGENPSSLTYIKAKQKACAFVGIESKIYQLPVTISEKELLTLIQKLNEDTSIHAILIQQPLPSHISPMQILLTLDPKKDVDGFHPINMGKLLLGEKTLIPCTPLGIQMLLTEYNLSTEGKHVVIIGRSNIVGKPLAALLSQKTPRANATVTLAHSKTQNLSQITRSADILISATGQPLSITQEHISPNTVVIDVGIHREGKRLIGDVDFEAVAPLASHITPVPGGIGPMTIAALLENTYRCFMDLTGVRT